MYDIITVGRRLRFIRKQLGIKQEEITGDVVTRNLISIIENDKANLTRKVAQVVVDQINRHPKAIEKKFSITLEQLLESPEEQIQIIVEKWMADIREGRIDVREENKKNEISELQVLINQYDLFELSFELNILCEAEIVKHKDFVGALDYAILAYEKSHRMMRSVKISDLIIRIGYYSIMLARYEDALYYYKILENAYPKMNNDDRFIVFYNRALALAHLKKYEEAIEAIDRILEFKNIKHSDVEHALLSKASVLVSLNRHRDAIKIYKQLLKTVQEDRNKYLIVTSLIDAYTTLNMKAELKEQMDYGIQLIEQDKNYNDISYISNLYYRIANGFKLLQDEESYLIYLEKSLTKSISDKRKSSIKSAFDDLIVYYLEKQDKNAVKELKKKLVQIYEQGLIDNSESTVWIMLEALAKLGQNKELMDLIKTMSPK